MKKIIPFIILLCSSIAVSQETAIRVAIPPFDDSISSEGEIARAGSVAIALYEQKLSALPNYKVRPSGAVQSYIETLEKVQLGIENPDTLKKIASSLSVDYLLVGSVANISGGIELDTRLVDINTWKVLHAGGIRSSSTADAASSLIDGYSKLSKQIIEETEKRRKDNFTVGVYEFIEHHKNTSSYAYCGAMMEMLTSSLGSKELITTIETKFIRHLIDEKQLQMSGVLTNDNSDENYRLSGVQYKVNGDIRVFPDLMTANYRIFDTSEKRVIFTGSVDISGPSVLRSAARYIAKVMEDALNNRIGSLKIVTNPPGADIILDEMPAGKTEKGTLVLTLEKGDYTLDVKYPGYKTYTQKISIVPRKVTELSIRLEKISEKMMAEAMNLEAIGRYSDAVKKYDEFIKEIGDTPEANVALYRKGHLLLLSKKDYEKARETFMQLLDRYPDAMTRAEGYYGLVLTYKEMGNAEMAKSTLKFLLDHYGETPAADTARPLLNKL